MYRNLCRCCCCCFVHVLGSFVKQRRYVCRCCLLMPMCCFALRVLQETACWIASFQSYRLALTALQPYMLAATMLCAGCVFCVQFQFQYVLCPKHNAAIVRTLACARFNRKLRTSCCKTLANKIALCSHLSAHVHCALVHEGLSQSESTHDHMCIGALKLLTHSPHCLIHQRLVRVVVDSLTDAPVLLCVWAQLHLVCGLVHLQAEVLASSR
jgi:hypothetical protein